MSGADPESGEGGDARATADEGEGAPTTADEGDARQPRWRRVLRWIGRGLAGLVALIVVLVLAILWVPPISQRTVATALGRWDGSIPGSVRWSDMRGSVAGGLTIEGVALADGDGRPLLRARSLTLNLDPGRLVRGELNLSALTLSGLDVHLDHAWGDLSKSKDPNAKSELPASEKQGNGPDLPLTIRVALAVDELRLLDDAKGLLVTVESVVAEARGEGRSADLALTLEGVVSPVADVSLDRLALVADWADPRVELEALEIDAPLVSLRLLAPAFLDVESMDGAVVLALEGAPEALAERLELDARAPGVRTPDRLALELRATTVGADEGLTAELGLDLDLGFDGHVLATVEGWKADEGSALSLSAGLAAHLAGGLADPRQPRIHLGASASVEGSLVSGLSLAAEVGLLEHAYGEQMWADANAGLTDLTPLAGNAELRVRAAGIEVGAKGRAGRDAGGRARLWVTEVGRPASLAAGLLGRPELADLRGRLEVDASCAQAPGSVGMDAVRCPVDVHIDSFSGFGVGLAAADIDGHIDPFAPELPFDVVLGAQGLSAPGGISLARIDASAFGTPSALDLEASGVGRRDSFSLDLSLENDPGRLRVELRELAVETRRTPRPARLRLQHPAAIELRDDTLGIEHLAVRAIGARIAADGVVALKGGSSFASVRVDNLDLARVDALAPGPAMQGVVHVDATLRGSIRDPMGSVAVDGRGLMIAATPLGDLAVRAKRGSSGGLGVGRSPAEVEPAILDVTELAEDPNAWAARSPGGRAGDLQLWVELRGPLSKRAIVAGRVPMQGLGLGRGPLDLRVAIERLDPTAFAAFLPLTPTWWDPTGPSAAPEGNPRWIPEGRLDLDLALAGTTGDPRAQLAVRGARLRLDRLDLGSFLIRAGLEQDGGDVELALHPSFAKRIDVRAHVPLAVDVQRKRARWLSREPHAVSVDVAGVDVDVVESTLGPSIPALGEALAAADLDGQFSISARLQGTPHEPEVVARVCGHDVAQGGVALGDVEVELAYGGDMAQAELRVRSPFAEAVDAMVEIAVHLDPMSDRVHDIGPETAIRGRVRAESFDLEHLVGFVGRPLVGRAEVLVQVDGRLAEPTLVTSAQVRELGLGREPIGDLLVRADYRRDELSLEVDLIHQGTHAVAVAAAAPVHADLAAGEMRWNRDGRHRLMVSARDIQRDLLGAFFDVPAALTTRADVDIHGGGSLQAFAFRGQIDATVGMGDAPPMTVHGELEADPNRQGFVLALKPEQGAGLDAAVDLRLPVVAAVEGRHPLGDTPFEAEVHADGFELQNLTGLLPETLHDPGGLLTIEAIGSGTLVGPSLRGELALADGAVTVVPLRQRLRGIELGVALANRRVDVTELRLEAGSGGLSGTGHADLMPGLGFDAVVELTLDELPFVRPGVPAMTIASGVEVDVHSRSQDLEIDVILSDTEVSVSTSNEQKPKAIPSDRGVVFVSSKADSTDPATNPTIQSEGAQGRLALSLKLADPLLIIGSSIDMAWAGAVELERIGPELRVGGELTARRGRLELAGSQFDIERGAVFLPEDGSLDPFLDLVAVTNTAEFEVKASVSGRVSRPELHFSSTPTLSEYQIFTLLVTGTTEVGEADESTLEAKAAGLLAAVSSPRLQQALDETLHIDRASIGFGDTVEQPILTVGKRITRDVYVETSYHHNAPSDENTAEVRVEYDFARRWSLESYFGDAAVGGVGTYWSRSIAAVPWRVSAQEREAAREAQGRRREQEQEREQGD